MAELSSLTFVYGGRYAREDTHYLLYIYDVMRLDLHAMAKEDEQSDAPLVEVIIIACYWLNPTVFYMAY